MALLGLMWLPVRTQQEFRERIAQEPSTRDFRLFRDHCRSDTVMGRGTSHCLVTLVERATGLAIVKKIAARNKAMTTRAIIQAIRQRGLVCKTLTFDNGTEFHGYRDIEAKLNVKCYFATPYHSWERGSNENLNGLLRQYLPKASSFRHLTQTRCNRIARALNTRPRKRHHYQSPEHVYARSTRSVALAS